MSDYNNYNDNDYCGICGGTNGLHDYDKHGYGNGNLGGSSGGRFVFGIFVVLGIIVGCACPPVGALIILFGAKSTGV
ncbi:MAG: hypothetical protein MJ133_07670 [Lachnospiraceae bacterium]|nr:hypothetical protein [Lachnospiraceae bacterium]